MWPEKNRGIWIQGFFHGCWSYFYVLFLGLTETDSFWQFEPLEIPLNVPVIAQ